MRAVDRGGAAAMPGAPDPVPDVVEPLSVAEQNERAADEEAVGLHSEPDVEADAAQTPAGGAVREGSSYDRGTESHEGLRRQTRRRRVDLPRRAGRRDRLPRSEWLREVDDDAVDSRAGPADGRHCDREREALPRPCGST